MKFRQAEKLKGEDIDNNIILHISDICSQQVAIPERRMRIFIVDDMRFLTKEFASVQSDVGNLRHSRKCITINILLMRIMPKVTSIGIGNIYIFCLISCGTNENTIENIIHNMI